VTGDEQQALAPVGRGERPGEFEGWPLTAGPVHHDDMRSQSKGLTYAVLRDGRLTHHFATAGAQTTAQTLSYDGSAACDQDLDALSGASRQRGM